MSEPRSNAREEIHRTHSMLDCRSPNLRGRTTSGRSPSRFTHPTGRDEISSWRRIGDGRDANVMAASTRRERCLRESMAATGADVVDGRGKSRAEVRGWSSES